MGDAAYGRDGEFYAAARLHLIRHGFAVPPVSLRVGRFAGLTRHRPVIQHRGPIKGKANGGASSGGTCLPAGRSVRGSDRPPACHSIPRTHQGEFLGDKKKRPGALLLALFIAFWRCRSGRSGTGSTGRRRGLRRGRRSWGCPWCRWSWCRWWAGSSNSRRRREPSPTWP